MAKGRLADSPCTTIEAGNTIIEISLDARDNIERIEIYKDGELDSTITREPRLMGDVLTVEKLDGAMETFTLDGRPCDELGRTIPDGEPLHEFVGLPEELNDVFDGDSDRIDALAEAIVEEPTDVETGTDAEPKEDIPPMDVDEGDEGDDGDHAVTPLEGLDEIDPDTEMTTDVGWPEDPDGNDW